jgi:hypothetical protein
MKLSSPYAFVSLGLLWVTLGAAGQQPPSNKQQRKIQMFTLQRDGSLSEISCETAASVDRLVASNAGYPRNMVTFALLPGGTAKIRYTAGQDIQIIALLPGSVDVRQLELLTFKTQGKTRVSYLGLGRSRGEPEVHWNTHSFHVGQLNDGRWLLEPTSQLSPGEYCFSPKFNHDNFCFGVDTK